jgi:hypothetical protein
MALSSFADHSRCVLVEVIEGSCLKELPKLSEAEFDLVLTSPPYCNRYDYTRTYALELAFCGSSEEDIRRLRQTLLSATVENKSKRAELSALYAQLGAAHRYSAIEETYEQQAALQEVLGLLIAARERDELSNPDVPNLVANYFLEMAQVVFELARVLKSGGHVVMVNDNVRYHGEEVPVDLILSDFAESASDLETTREAYRAGFIALALEKNHRATPFVARARALKEAASRAKSATELLDMEDIHSVLLTATGVSDKAASHLEDADKREAILGLIKNFLERLPVIRSGHTRSSSRTRPIRPTTARLLLWFTGFVHYDVWFGVKSTDRFLNDGGALQLWLRFGASCLYVSRGAPESVQRPLSLKPQKS